MAYGSTLDVRTYACACGPGMGHTTWRMGRHWTGELDRRGRRVLGGGVNVTPGPIWMAHEWPQVRMFSATLLVEQGWSQLISLSTSHTTLGLTLLHEARTKV
jgi:hypothetical protein